MELLQNKFGKNLIVKENLSKYSWFNLGGPADIFFRPETKQQLIEFLNEIKNSNFKIFILGNIIISLINFLLLPYDNFYLLAYLQSV